MWIGNEDQVKSDLIIVAFSEQYQRQIDNPWEVPFPIALLQRNQ